METPTIWTPIRTSRFEFDGRVVYLRAGRTTIEDGHPILEGRMHNMKPFEVDYPVERLPVAPAAKQSTVADSSGGAAKTPAKSDAKTGAKSGGAVTSRSKPS